jgi:hypothetical protein
MRTTLSLDPDVATLLKRAMARNKTGLKEQVNAALRAGLTALTRAPRRKRVATRSFNAGRCLIGSVDNVADALAIAEGEAFR